jgi:hypothetical protein
MQNHTSRSLAQASTVKSSLDSAPCPSGQAAEPGPGDAGTAPGPLAPPGTSGGKVPVAIANHRTSGA